MRIAYVGNFQPLSVGENEIASSFSELGHEIVKIGEGTSIDELKKMSDGCDLLLFAKFRCGSPNERYEIMKNFAGPSVCWVFDLYWTL